MKKNIFIILILLIALGIGVFIGSQISHKKEIKEKVKEEANYKIIESTPPKPFEQHESEIATDTALDINKEENKEEDIKSIVQETFSKTPKLAILIDDSGATVSLAEEFSSLGIPLSFAVIPYLAKSREVNEYLSQRGYTVILHLPMEGSDIAVNEKTKGLLTTSLSKEEIIQTFSDALENIGPVRGFNNHMGSVFTSSQEDMDIVLNYAKSKKLFYVDSKTIASSKGFSTAKKLGIPAAQCVHFLDNSKNVADIEVELEKAVKIAQRRGNALVIGHYHKNMIEALKNSKELLTNSNIKLVFIDEILQ